jgi:hypothetical protein
VHDVHDYSTQAIILLCAAGAGHDAADVNAAGNRDLVMQQVVILKAQEPFMAAIPAGFHTKLYHGMMPWPVVAIGGNRRGRTAQARPRSWCSQLHVGTDNSVIMAQFTSSCTSQCTIKLFLQEILQCKPCNSHFHQTN